MIKPEFFYNFYGTTYTLPTLWSWYLATDDLQAKLKAEKVVDWLLGMQEKGGALAGAWFSQYAVELAAMVEMLTWGGLDAVRIGPIVSRLNDTLRSTSSRG